MPEAPEESQKHMQQWMQWMGDLATQGKFVGAQPLEAFEAKFAQFENK